MIAKPGGTGDGKVLTYQFASHACQVTSNLLIFNLSQSVRLLIFIAKARDSV